MTNDKIEEHLRCVRLLAMDIDGTLTDGGVREVCDLILQAQKRLESF